jgi:HD-like signal output (HDOD) protein
MEPGGSIWGYPSVDGYCAESFSAGLESESGMPAEILELVKKADALPAFPMLATEALRLTRQEDVSIDKLASLVHRDPAMAATVLRAANSAFLGANREITELKPAMLLLGLRTVEVLVLTFALKSSLAHAQSSAFDYQLYWRRSITTGVAARLLARAVEPRLVETAFVSGLMCDLGMVAACTLAPKLYEPVLQAKKNDPRPIEELELEILGVAHPAMSRELLAAWQLPETVHRAVGAHHGTGLVDLTHHTLRLAQVVYGAASVAALFVKDVPSAQLGRVKRHLVGELKVPDRALSSVFEAIDIQVREMASLLAAPVGETLNYARLQVDAALQLSQLTLLAEKDQTVAPSQGTDYQRGFGIARRKSTGLQERLPAGTGTTLVSAMGNTKQVAANVEATTTETIAADAGIEVTVLATPVEIAAAAPVRSAGNPRLVGPQRAPEIQGATVALHCRAIEQGGGLYDFIPLSGNRIALMIGNINTPAGDASQRRELARKILGNWIRNTPDPLAALCGANDELSVNLGGNCTVSVAVAIIDPKTRAIRMARAGHPPPILHRPVQRPPFLRFDGTGYTMGLSDRRQFQRSLKPCVAVAAPGDGLLLYTEALLKAENLAGEEFGMGNVFTIVDQLRDDPPDTLLEKLIQEWDVFTEGVPQADDLATIFVRFNTSLKA